MNIEKTGFLMLLKIHFHTLGGNSVRGIGNRILHSGEWGIDEIKVKVFNFKHARIYFEKYIVNAPKHYIDVRIKWSDRRKGITLDDKIKKSLNELKSDLEKKNSHIKEIKRIENSFNN
jgi:hypothetical protein